MAFLLLQRLEFPLDVCLSTGRLELEKDKENLNFMQEKSIEYLTDCVEIYLDRESRAGDSGREGENIPERTVPLVLDPNDKNFWTEIKSEAKNEKGETAGRFGWCVGCRKGADLYCKDSRFPICSPACKRNFMEREAAFEAVDIRVNRKSVEKRKQLVQDCLNMFRTFMRHAFSDSK